MIVISLMIQPENSLVIEDPQILAHRSEHKFILLPFALSMARCIESKLDLMHLAMLSAKGSNINLCSDV